MQLVDTHCHIHEAADPRAGSDATRQRWAKLNDPSPSKIIARAKDAGVTRMICVGTTLEDSHRAVDFVQTRPECYASIGIHPHEAADHLELSTQKRFSNLMQVEGWRPLGDPQRAQRREHDGGRMGRQDPHLSKIVAVGECGLDFYYNHSPKADQIKVLKFQIELALQHGLPMIFHVRDAFEDFWPIFDSYQGIRGVVHSFTATKKELNQALERGLYIGLNGIMTFTKDAAQLDAAKAVPLDRLLLETDAPFLTPMPHRGTICEPKHTRVVSEFLAELTGVELSKLAKITTQNARKLFKLE